MQLCRRSEKSAGLRDKDTLSHVRLIKTQVLFGGTLRILACN